MKITNETVFSTSHPEGWRNKVARDLNTLLGRCQYFHDTSNDASDKDAEKATHSIVKRVAEFEEIQIVKKKSRVLATL